MTAPLILNSALQRLASQSATCKIYSSVLAGAALLFAAGRSGGGSLLWAAAPAIVLALVDAGYTAKARSLASEAHKSVPDSSDTAKSWSIIQLQVASGGMAEAGKALMGLFSFSVWPFYMGLALMVIGLGDTILIPKNTGLPTASFPQQMMPTTNQGLQINSPSLQNINQAPPNRPFPANAQNSFPRNVPMNGQPQPATGIQGRQQVNPVQGIPTLPKPPITPPSGSQPAIKPVPISQPAPAASLPSATTPPVNITPKQN